ncbi:MAG: hypothetical protein APU95_04185 [Hadesarchaea archaeon YNP_N21]|jgi:hypothetical protein|nr:MAG: hypothetical protein APU95_04185 [Hadesarchaea archaeon YNP_N21]
MPIKSMAMYAARVVAFVISPSGFSFLLKKDSGDFYLYRSEAPMKWRCSQTFDDLFTKKAIVEGTMDKSLSYTFRLYHSESR